MKVEGRWTVQFRLCRFTRCVRSFSRQAYVPNKVKCWEVKRWSAGKWTVWWLHRRERKLSRIIAVFHWKFLLIKTGKAALIIGRGASFETCSATWDLGANSVFALGLRKTIKTSTELAGRRDFQLLPNFQIRVRHCNTGTFMVVAASVSALL
jgi:hypothetical protein